MLTDDFGFLGADGFVVGVFDLLLCSLLVARGFLVEALVLLGFG